MPDGLLREDIEYLFEDLQQLKDFLSQIVANENESGDSQ